MSAPDQVWPCDLGEPVQPLDTWYRYQALSALTGVEMADGGPVPLLAAEHARDVVQWRQGRGA